MTHDEPYFLLKSTDPLAPVIVELWASLAELHSGGGLKVEEARMCANSMRAWRGAQLGEAESNAARPAAPLPRCPACEGISTCAVHTCGRPTVGRRNFDELLNAMSPEHREAAESRASAILAKIDDHCALCIEGHHVSHSLLVSFVCVGSVFDANGAYARGCACAWRPTIVDTERALRLAQRFHDIYEELAPQFGYETRTDTRTFDAESADGRFMVAVCRVILHEFVDVPTAHEAARETK